MERPRAGEACGVQRPSEKGFMASRVSVPVRMLLPRRHSSHLPSSRHRIDEPRVASEPEPKRAKPMSKEEKVAAVKAPWATRKGR